MNTTATRRPEAGQVRVTIDAIGTMTAATIADVGSPADGFVRGDRVAYPVSLGDQPVVPVATLVGIPRNVSDRQAAELLAPGLVAHAMLTQVRPFVLGERVAVTLGNALLRDVVSAWVEAMGGDLVEGAPETDVLGADVVYDEQVRRDAAVQASHRQGRLQQAATEVFQAIRAGVFDGVHVGRRESERVAA